MMYSAVTFQIWVAWSERAPAASSAASSRRRVIGFWLTVTVTWLVGTPARLANIVAKPGIPATTAPREVAATSMGYTTRAVAPVGAYVSVVGSYVTVVGAYVT